MIVFDFDEDDARPAGIGVGDRPDVATQRRHAPSWGWVARIASEEEDVEPDRIRRFERQRGGHGLVPADVVELVPEARRRRVTAGELTVSTDRDRVGGGGACLRLS